MDPIFEILRTLDAGEFPSCDTPEMKAASAEAFRLGLIENVWAPLGTIGWTALTPAGRLVLEGLDADEAQASAIADEDAQRESDDNGWNGVGR